MQIFWKACLQQEFKFDPENTEQFWRISEDKKNILGRTIYSKHLQLTKKAKKIPGNFNNALPSGEKS